MALYHFHVTQIKRSEGRTAVASAAYRAGEKLHNLWDGETHAVCALWRSQMRFSTAAMRSRTAARI